MGREGGPPGEPRGRWPVLAQPRGLGWAEGVGRRPAEGGATGPRAGRGPLQHALRIGGSHLTRHQQLCNTFRCCINSSRVTVFPFP